MSSFRHPASFSPPEKDGLMPRPRLFQRLEQWFRSVIWIAGPPGSGKTSLAASFAHEHAKPVIWLHCNNGSDCNPASIFNRLRRAAILAHEASHEKQAGLSLQQNAPSDKELVDFGQIIEFLPHNCLIVFDNYHLPEDSAHHLQILENCVALTTRAQVIITSRFLPPKAAIRLFVERSMHLVSWEDLCFSQAECKQLFDPDSFSPAVLNFLYQKTQGWIAGLILLAARLRRNHTAIDAPDRLLLEDIFAYLDLELFQKLPPASRLFLIKTAFLPKMTREAVAAVTGCKQAGDVLEQLMACGCLISRLPGRSLQYAHHPLMAAFLQHLADSQLDPVEQRRLYVDSAGQLEAMGRLENAAQLLEHVRAHQQLLALTLRHGASMIEHGRLKILEGWIRVLPKTTREQEPWLLVWLGRSCSPRNHSQSIEYYHRAFQAFQAQSDTVGLLTAWCGGVDALLFAWSHFQRLDEWIATLESLLEKGFQIPISDLGVRTASCMVGALVYRRPERLDKIYFWLERAFLHPGGQNTKEIHVHSGFHAAHHAMWLGNLCRLRVITENIQRMLNVPEAPRSYVLKTKILSALVQSLCHGRGDLALERIQEMLPQADQLGMPIWTTMLLGQAVFGALTADDPATAKRYLRKMDVRVPRQQRFARGHFHYVAASVHLYSEDVAQAERHARQALAIAEETGALCALPYCTLALAQICFEVGEEEESRMLMEGLEAAGGIKSEGGMPHYMLLLCSAYFALRRRLPEQGLILLRQAFALGRKEGYLNTFMLWRPKMMAFLCITALRHSIAPEYALLLIQRRNLVPESPPLDVMHWPWPVRIMTLGHFELTLDNVPVTFTGKVQHRPLTLLKFLAIQEEPGATEEDIHALLWPEADPERAHSAFSTNLSRLRKILGRKDAIVSRDGRYQLNQRICWVDVKAFLSLCNHAQGLESYRVRKDDSRERTSSFPEDPCLSAVQALDLYKGSFLPGDTDEPWIQKTRQRAERALSGLVRVYGEFLESKGAWDEARAFYLRALDVYDAHADVYRRLAHCAQRLDRPHEMEIFRGLCRERLRSNGTTSLLAGKFILSEADSHRFCALICTWRQTCRLSRSHALEAA